MSINILEQVHIHLGGWMKGWMDRLMDGWMHIILIHSSFFFFIKSKFKEEE